jgi:hypothetical protein
MKKIALFGMLLNQMVVACIEIDGVEQVANLFQKVKFFWRKHANLIILTILMCPPTY